MLSSDHQLIELVRLLEQRQYVFRADPKAVTAALKHEAGADEWKLLQRALRLDVDGRLQQTLADAAGRGRWLLRLLTGLWLVLGFVGMATLMQASAVNFFSVLASLLGLHSVMLLLWLVLMFQPVSGSPWWTAWLFWRGKDAVHQAALALAGEQLAQKNMRWWLGKISHQLWLATLSGMFLGMLLLLLVRQYTFNWESTLLSSDALVWLVSALAWLPEKLGFPVPDAQAIAQSQSGGQTAWARAWAGLLLGSVLCYGWLPRFAAWLLCLWQSRRQHSALPLSLPYYQRLLQYWHTRVVDADTAPAESVRAAPAITISSAPKLAALLHSPWPDAYWYGGLLGQAWQDAGLIDGRDDFEHLLADVRSRPLQVLVGVRAQVVPDRGILRQLETLAQAAQGGLVVALLGADGLPETRRQQWQEALAQRDIVWLVPGVRHDSETDVP